MSLCPESEERSKMSDAEFWEHVLLPRPNPRTDEYAFEIDQEEYEMISNMNAPCAECGVIGPCGYDLEQRPYIHVVQGTEE